MVIVSPTDRIIKVFWGRSSEGQRCRNSGEKGGENQRTREWMRLTERQSKLKRHAAAEEEAEICKRSSYTLSFPRTPGDDYFKGPIT